MPTPTIKIITPLNDDLLFKSMAAHEQLSCLAEYSIELLSRNGNVDMDAILAKRVTVKAELPEEGQFRYFDGYVTRFAQVGFYGSYHRYHAVVRPWLWFLTRTSDCRIFQDMKVPDIIKKIFDDHGQIADFKLALSGTYEPRNYCVQYRETDFNFVSRLMEEEGIYYYFQHQQGRHTLVLTDAPGGHEKFAGYEEVRFIPHDRSMMQAYERIAEWRCEREVQSGRYTIDDYDFTKPSVELRVDTKQTRKNDLSNLEMYDYPGMYTARANGQQFVQARLDELQSNYELTSGRAMARGLCCGYLFKLAGHDRNDQNREYLITSTQYSLHYNEYEASDEGETTFECSFTAMNSSQQFRPPRISSKALVNGPQTAVVVGPGGDEIYTDKYGRVKVQFHWDREGKKNENSSCWMRVSHPWAGKNWGMIAIPRIGQEVIVDFLEGDPDLPIITGRVYNAEQMPPYDLPANMTQTGIKTRSTKGGSGANFNEIRFEDKKGSEQLYIHAEKNQDIEVENDETHWVGHDRSKTIDHDETVHVKHDRTETVDNNETITIGNNRTEKVGVDETITIGSNRTETVGSNETITIGSNRTETVGSNETITIGSNRTITIGSNETATVALQRTHTVGVNETIAIGAAQEIAIGAMQAITVGANQSLSVGANQSNDIGSNRSTQVGKDDKLNVGKNLVIEAGDSVTIKTGSASITMKKDGTITIKGKDITLDGSGKINVKAGGNVVMKGSKILQN